MSQSASALQRAVKAAGTQEKLAAAIGTKQQNVSYWVRAGQVPAEFVLKIEEATGIPRHELRGDLYPQDEASAA